MFTISRRYQEKIPQSRVQQKVIRSGRHWKIQTLYRLFLQESLLCVVLFSLVIIKVKGMKKLTLKRILKVLQWFYEGISPKCLHRCLRSLLCFQRDVRSYLPPSTVFSVGHTSKLHTLNSYLIHFQPRLFHGGKKVTWGNTLNG